MICFVENAGHELNNSGKIVPGFDILACGQEVGELIIISVLRDDWEIAQYPIAGDVKGVKSILIMGNKKIALEAQGDMEKLFNKIRDAYKIHGTKAWQAFRTTKGD